MYEYEWIPGPLARTDVVEEMAALYSRHYGIWGAGSGLEGKPVRLSGARLRDWLTPESRIALAREGDEVIGYAIAVQSNLPRHGMVSWVTQFVVHEQYRRQDVGKTLLFTIWHVSNHFAWGLVSANPYAVRALEKATRRRCLPSRIGRHHSALLKMGTTAAPYIHNTTEFIVGRDESRVNTGFLLDHSGLPKMLSDVTTEENPWSMGPIPEGWEWFAFTFHDQPPIALTEKELEQMLLASDSVTKRAYSRMLVRRSTQLWTKHSDSEVDFIIGNCIPKAAGSILDFGCGSGRHALGLAGKGFAVTGIDYVEDFIRIAQKGACDRGLHNVTFQAGDCRTIALGVQFDAAVCLYDVIGTYADDEDNFRILANMTRHLKPGGALLLSVMNLELTERRAQQWFSVTADPQTLLHLKASNTMERTGDIFDPEYYAIDRETKLVYRKEQFSEGDRLPEELLVRDRRYTNSAIQGLCMRAGLNVRWSRYVRSGHWEESLPRDSDLAKEILVLCEKA